MTDEQGKTLLLTGPPGVGKTTVIRRVAQGLSGRRIRGFTTEEVREGGERVGFRIETFDGDSAFLAHVQIQSKHRVGRYGVDLAALDRVVDSALSPGQAEITLVDEIGKMECLSPRFVAAMERLLESGQLLVATVGSRGGGFIEQVKHRPGVTLLRVSRANRETLAGEVLAWIASRRP